MCDRFLLLLLLLLLLVLLRFCLLGWLFDYQTTPLPYHRCILGVRGGGSVPLRLCRRSSGFSC